MSEPRFKWIRLFLALTLILLGTVIGFVIFNVKWFLRELRIIPPEVAESDSSTDPENSK